MARLPSERYLIQQIGGEVVLFEEGTERELLRVPTTVAIDDGPNAPRKVNADGFARAQRVITQLGLGDEDTAFAHFWCGYFYAHAGGLILPNQDGYPNTQS